MSNSAAPTNASVDSLVGQVADEFTQRLNRGERPSIEDYAKQHPEIAEQLRAVLPMLGLLRRPDVEAALADSDPNLAEPLGDFRLVREIGRGGMGVVYEAKQLSLNRKVAVKVLPLASALDQRQLQRFKNEALAAASLHHEHIVQVYAVGCERGVHFYAMQFIKGLSLAALIAELRRLATLGQPDTERTAPYSYPPGAPPAAETNASPLAALTTEGSMRSPGYFHNVARLGLEAAKGLEHAHQGCVLHRDIKPANLLVDGCCSLWIADFGLAQMRNETRLTLTGELNGTLRYMSPEQALAKRVVVDQRTDVYSLGATLYELLTLEPVFNGNDRQELLRQIAFDDPIPPRRLNRHVPRDLETIVLTALAKAPGHRYATAKEMAEDLERFLNDQPIKARPERALRWLWRRSRQHAARIAVGLAAVITAAVLLLFFLHLNKPSPEEMEEKRQQEALTVHTRDLDLKKKIILIGERGSPGYFRWRSNKTLGQIVAAPDGTFLVQHWEHGLVELLPDPRLPAYRFSAEVRQEDQTNQECKVGIYFAHYQYQDGEAIWHFHCNVAFNDMVDVGAPEANGGHQGNVVGLQAHRQPSAGLLHHTVQFKNADYHFTPEKPKGNLGRWRRIDIEVRPENIKVFWERRNIATTTRAKMMKSAPSSIASVDKPLQGNSPRFAPGGGLGLFVSQGIASFKNVTVEPLDAEN